MKHALLAVACILVVGAYVAVHPDRPERSEIRSGGARLQVETFVRGLDTPWDLAWGPDGRIWVTERGGRISRVDPATGVVEEAGRLDVVERGESGLMGIAFHPDFPNEPWVYVAHSYGGSGIRNRLVRMRWRNGVLGAPEVVLDGIAGAGNHNGTRLAFGPDGMLYVTTGDAGNAARAQDRDNLSGKILRLTPEGRPATGNPWNTAVWSMGHRNPQGLVFRPGTDELYETEHGPSEADEVNRIHAGRNYGWPDVHGACDEGGERSFCAQHDVVEPIVEFTPTVGISGLDVYDSDRIPEWRGSLLYTSLRGGTLFRTDPATGRTERLLEGEYGRLRDVLVAPTGEVYVATSNRDGRGRPAADDDRILRITSRLQPGGQSR